MSNQFNKQYDSINRVFALGEIKNETICELIEFIYIINNDDIKKTHNKRIPIKLILNSSGGSVYDGFALIDVIESSKTPIHIYIHGQAQSMGFAIATCGHKRYASKRATFMYHECSWETGNEKLQSHEQELQEGKRLWGVYDDVIISNTKITRKVLSNVRKQRKEWYITAQDALKLGIIDEII